MKKFIGRILKILLRTGVIGESIKIVYRGKGVSLNQFYSQGHWGTRSALKKKYRKKFDELFAVSKNLRWLDKFSIIIYYNSRHDLDNVTGMEKVFVDALKREVDRETGEVIRDGYILDDNKNHYRGMCIFPDESLPSNTFEFYLIEHK